MDKGSLKVVGIVGARSGSKGVPNKNIQPLAGKPLMAWILGAAGKSRYINRLIVSTDSEEYAGVAVAYGAEVPYLRPKELADDWSPEIEYVKHALGWLQEHEGYRPDLVVRLLPTVPLQQAEDIDAAVEELLKDPEAHSAVVIAEARQHPEKALKLIDDGKGGAYLVTYRTESGREVTPIARQNYRKAYFRANVIVSRTEAIAETSSLTGDRVRYHIIPQERAIDIDTVTDFFVAEQLMKKFGLVDASHSIQRNLHGYGE
jgi:CMP-N-acetylneuraminic acid synthetase